MVALQRCGPPLAIRHESNMESADTPSKRTAGQVTTHTWWPARLLDIERRSGNGESRRRQRRRRHIVGHDVRDVDKLAMLVGDVQIGELGW